MDEQRAHALSCLHATTLDVGLWVIIRLCPKLEYERSVSRKLTAPLVSLGLACVVNLMCGCDSLLAVRGFDVGLCGLCSCLCDVWVG